MITADIELPGMPAPEKSRRPKRGSKAWKALEWERFRNLSREMGGLTTAVMAAEMLGFSRQRMSQLVKADRLRTVELFGRKMLSCEDIEAFSKLERDTAFRYDVA